MPVMTTTSVPMTANQTSFIKTMIKERQVPENVVETMRALYRVGRFDAQVASKFITMLHKYPYRENVVPRTGDEQMVGRHRVGNRFFEVLKAKNSGRLYANEVSREPNGELVTVYNPEALQMLSRETLI